MKFDNPQMNLFNADCKECQELGYVTFCSHSSKVYCDDCGVVEVDTKGEYCDSCVEGILDWLYNSNQEYLLQVARFEEGFSYGA